MIRTTAALILIVACGGFGQAPPVFYAASVKRNVEHQADGEGHPIAFINPAPGSLRVQNSTLKQCIQWAYNVQESQISGPSWMESERFDIVARSAGQAPIEQLRLMLQNLLKERFKL